MIDINCDLGEGLDNEHLLMPLISSCNIACGGHAGAIKIIDKVIQLAIQYHVKIGAHPGFPDKKNFGRVVMDISDKELRKSLKDQLQLFKERAELQNAKIHHIKPHGALYNLIAIDAEKAQLVVEVIKQVFGSINIYVPYQSEIEKAALQNELSIIYEAFADRNYNDNLTLVSRALPYAILTNKEKIGAHVKKISEESLVRTIQDNEQEIKAETFCLHGDHKKAIEILKYLNEEFMSD